jgi:RNA polymerase sigma-70 factor (ECF subfamily)
MPATTSESNRTALIALLVASYDELKLRLTRRSGSADVADEALQDTYLRLNSAANIEPVRNPHAYLFRVAMSVASNRGVAERRRLTVSETDTLLNLVDDSPDPERIVEARSEIEALQRVIKELPARTRDIVMAVFVDEVPLRHVAGRFGISIRTVQVELKQALLHCAVRLGRDAAASNAPRRRLNSVDHHDRARRLFGTESAASADELRLIPADDRSY